MKEYFPAQRPHILAHRGLALSTIENTLEAFEQALRAGATHIETDAHATSDGVAVLFHDDILSGKSISQYLYAELPPYIPRLSDALERFPHARFNIDIKSEGAVRSVSQTVNDCNAANRILITSFDEKRRSDTVALTLGCSSSASAKSFALALIFGKLGLSKFAIRFLTGLDAVQIPERALGLQTTSPRMMSLYRAAGVIVHVWTVNDPQHMRELISRGVDGIVTDRTDLAAQEFNTRNQDF